MSAESYRRAHLPDHNHIIDERYEKAAAIAADGVELFPRRWLPSHSSQEVLDGFDALQAAEKSVRVAGRMMTIRRMGKAIFLNLQDGAGKIQVYVRRDSVPEENFDLLKQKLDLGDYLGIEGGLMVTKTGEKTVKATNLVLLSKSMRPPPDKWHGLQDVELRYRQRYVDLYANPDVRETFRQRATIVRSFRQFLDERNYLEIETPMMQPIHGGATARPFETFHNALDMPLYLRIAPELYHKRLLVGGIEKVYEINRNFRNEGLSTRHNPEFTMLELYTSYWDYNDTLELTEELLRYVAGSVETEAFVEFDGEKIEILGDHGWRRITILQAVNEATGQEWSWGMTADAARAQGEGRLGGLREPQNRTTAEIIMFLFEELVEPTLVQPTFVTEYPAELSPLAKTKKDDPLVAERFELFIARLEVANGYSELNDPARQWECFRNQLEKGQDGDEEAHLMDEDYVRALEVGMPPASGLGIGIDRITMLLTGNSSIRDVILFPQMRPEVHTESQLETEAKEATREAAQEAGA